MSSLLLAGIIKIIKQHDALANLEEKVKNAESENVSNKLQIESLENWVTRQEDSLKVLERKLAVEVVKTEVSNVDKSENNVIKLKSKTKCKECGKLFYKNCDLEEHLKHSSVIHVIRSSTYFGAYRSIHKYKLQSIKSAYTLQ